MALNLLDAWGCHGKALDRILSSSIFLQKLRIIFQRKNIERLTDDYSVTS